MDLVTASYTEQAALWPPTGRHVLAQHDAETVIVYQAFRPSIANFAIRHGSFGHDFSYARMSWIKPNFLWMMYRSGWGTKEDQEMTLGLRLGRRFFDGILGQAVASSLGESCFEREEDWKAALRSSEARLQWDPDHDPHGRAVARRAIQLGLRGSLLEAFGKRELLEVIDMTAFVEAQRAELQRSGTSRLRTPLERLYVPGDEAVAKRLGLDRPADTS